MPQRVAQLSVADNLCQLAAEFQSGDPTMASAIRKEFKTKSKNDVTRAVVYLMEVIGSRDEQFKVIQKENADLKELLKINGVKLDGEGDEVSAGLPVSGGNTTDVASGGDNTAAQSGRSDVTDSANVTT